MRWIKMLIALSVVAIVFVVVVAIQPSRYSVARTAIVSAPPAEVFAQVNDFRNWEAWSPWAKLDPGMRQTYEGVTAGVGAVYTWAGNSEVGEGRMTLIQSRPNDLIRIELELLKPFAGIGVAEFTFTAEGDAYTAVRWSIRGEKTFVAKVVHLFLNMDELIGRSFERGLAKMKSIVEAEHN